jgi:hypothetical protein
LSGPSNLPGTPHYAATQLQTNATVRGTFGTERQVAHDALVAAGLSDAEAIRAVQEAQEHFTNLGVTPDTPTRIPGKRHQ